VEEWLNAGTSLVWVVNPKRNTIHVYRPARVSHILTAGDIITGEDVVTGFSASVKEIFG